MDIFLKTISQTSGATFLTQRTKQKQIGLLVESNTRVH